MPPVPSKASMSKASTSKASMVDTDPANRPVKYDHLSSFIAVGADRLTASQAKELLGWTEDEEEAKANGLTDPHLKDLYDRKVWLLNNTGNREYNDLWARTIAQDVLNKQFAPKGPNGEAVIIGKTGLVLSAQHRLVGLVLAEQARNGPDKHKWVELWDGECWIETFVSYGVDESPETIQTLDNVRPRSEADVIFTDQAVKDKVGTADRSQVSRMLSFASRLLWSRTGVGKGCNHPYTPRRTKSEVLGFVHRHMRLVAAAKHILQEDKTGSISKRIGLGYASALLYLMGASDTNPEEYHQTDGYDEKHIDWKAWNKAVDFWTLFNKLGSDPAAVPEFKALRFARRPVLGQDREDTWQGYVFTGGKDSGSLAEKCGVIVKSWNLFKAGETITEKRLALDYECEWSDPDSENNNKISLLSFRLSEVPEVSGIDLGDPKDTGGDNEDQVDVIEGEVGEDTDNGGGDSTDPTPEEIEAATEVARRKRDKADNKPVFETIAAEIKAVQDAHPNTVLLFKGGGVVDEYVVWGDNLDLITFPLDLPATCKPKRDMKVGLMRMGVPGPNLQETLSKLYGKGLKCAVVSANGKEVSVHMHSEAPAKPAAKPGKPAAGKGSSKAPAKLRGGTGK